MTYPNQVMPRPRKYGEPPALLSIRLPLSVLEAFRDVSDRLEGGNAHAKLLGLLSRAIARVKFDLDLGIEGHGLVAGPFAGTTDLVIRTSSPASAERLQRAINAWEDDRKG